MKKFDLFKKVWGVACKYKNYFVVSYAVLIMELAFKQVSPWLLGKLMDVAIYENNITRFGKIALIYLVVFVCLQTCSFVQLMLWQMLDNRFVYDLRARCLKKILKLTGKELSYMKTGDMIHTINDDTIEFHHLFQRYAMRTINAGIGSAVSIVLIAVVKWEIAVISVALIIVSLLLTNSLKKKLKKIAHNIRTKVGDYEAWITEMIKGLREIKLFVSEKNIFLKMKTKNEDLIEMDEKQTIMMFGSNVLIDTVYTISQIVFYIVCAFIIGKNGFGVAEYIMVSGYYTLISENFQKILKNEMDFQKREVAIERVFNLMSKEDENNQGLSDLVIENGEIVIEDLKFKYDENSEIMTDLSCHISPGEKVGIVGQSGTGKSTFAHLLVKFFCPESGRIMVDHQDLNKCTYESIRKAIGIISQDVILFDMTVKQNICFDDDVDDETIWNILDMAYLKEDIMKLPNGINTVIGEKGVLLSGGQSQRLSIARLLYKNPPIVILDEATSALDQESEKIVQQSLDSLTKNRTSIIISHRFNSIRETDKVLVLKEGTVVAEDHYESLFGSNKFFSDLFLAQYKKLKTV